MNTAHHSPMPSGGCLLFAHGARDPAWALPFESIRGQLQRLDPRRPVELAFLEFMSPGLLEAGDRLVAQGCTQVSVIPLFLGAGGHVRKDVPELMAGLRSRHPHIRWTLSPAIGEQPEVCAAMAEACLRLCTNDLSL